MSSPRWLPSRVSWRISGGDKIQLDGTIPEGINSHTFEPVPSDVKILARADLLIVNGLDLENPTL